MSSSNEDDLYISPDFSKVNVSGNRIKRSLSIIQSIGAAMRISNPTRPRSLSNAQRPSVLSPPLFIRKSVSIRESISKKQSQEDIERNKELNAYLDKEKETFEILSREPKMIVLGSSDSGKTTLLKQMKILYGEGFTDEERNGFSLIIRKEIVSYIYVLIEMVTEYEYRDIKKKYANLLEFLQNFKKGDDKVLVDRVQVTVDRLLQMQNAWKEPVIQEKFLTVSHNLPDSTLFFMEKMETVFKENYQPTNEDILKVRSSTLSVNDTEFYIKGQRLHVIDVNGFSQSRSTWLQYFDSITCVLFVASLSSYDQVMMEESDVNRMVDSIVLFQDLANNKQLEDKQFILFLNKKDIYEKKIKTKNIIDYFPGYKGASGDIAQGIKYFESKFLDQKIVSKQITSHVMSCTDTEDMKDIISTVIQTVLMGRLRDTGVVF